LAEVETHGAIPAYLDFARYERCVVDFRFEQKKPGSTHVLPGKSYEHWLASALRVASSVVSVKD
jgi:hypothetical protein